MYDNLLERLEDTAPYRALKFGLNRKLVDFFRERALKGGTGRKVGEFACGSGYASHLLAEAPEVAVSIALDRNMVLFDQAEQEAFSAHFVQADLFKPPFPDADFDLVWSHSSLEHFPDPGAALKAMAHQVRPGGHVFIGVPYLVGPLALYYALPSASWREWVGKPFSRPGLEALFRANGMEPVASFPYFLNCFLGVLGKKR